MITGTADMCSGAPGEPPHNVQTRLLEGKRLVGRETFLGSHIFRFSVIPGRYTVTSDHSYATPSRSPCSPATQFMLTCTRLAIERHGLRPMEAVGSERP